MTVSRLLDGGTIGAEASLNKIFWSEMDVRMHETALQLLGDQALLGPGAPDAVDDARWLDGYLFSLSGPIYAGTNEIQRNVIADRVLNLPRGT
jgi:alkylation response protein AidB-like acyl-CoA dehydrogenase